MTEIDHDMNMRMLQYGFDQLTGQSENLGNEIEIFPERQIKMRPISQVKLSLNPGAFIRKAINKRLANYWTYKGSFTYPGKYSSLSLLRFVNMQT